MARAKGAIVVDIEKCKGCELCVVNCPTNVIQLTRVVNGKGYHYAYMEIPEACTGCTNCALVCPDGVISVYQLRAVEQNH
jgi:2-oxoglutarate ferredoxin oxidoreductase subunit delta